jgi:hypothetical protein
MGPKGGKGILGPPGPKGVKGDTGYTTTITTVRNRTKIEDQVYRPDICVDVEIVFNEAPAEGCTLSPDAVKRSIATQLEESINDIQGVKLSIRTQQDKRQLQATFITTEKVERAIRKKKGHIKLPLDQARCNYTTVFAKGAT